MVSQSLRQHPLSNVLLRSRSALIAVAAFSAGINLLILTGSVYMMQIFDRVLTGQSKSTLLFLTLLALFFLTIYGLLELARSRILVRLATWLDQFLSPLVFSRGLESCVSGQQNTHGGLNDLANLRGFISGPGLVALLDAPWVPIYLLVTFMLHPLIGLVTSVAVVILFCAAVLAHLVNTRQLSASAERARANNLLVHAAFRNAALADSMGMLGALVRRWRDGNAEVLGGQQAASDRMGMVTAATKFFRSALQVVVLGIGAWLVIDHQLSAGGMTAASIIMARALAPVEATVASWKQICSAASAWKNLGELLRRGKLHAGSIRLPQPKGRLQVEDVTHVPDGAARPALLGVSLEILPGEVLAIVGPSGAGKSTLVRLMVGIACPTRGCVRLDDADLFLWDRSDLGQHIGYLPQTVELLPGTIKDNIARMQEDPDPARVIEAAKVAGVHELILRLPEGYETQIVGEAANLSGGQKQRIGLARALYGNPALVVLDEPNSNLDSVGDEALNQAIHSAKQLGSTVVIVAHRPSLMRHVDKVAILNEGSLHMFGPKAKVLGSVQRVSEIPTAKAS